MSGTVWKSMEKQMERVEYLFHTSEYQSCLRKNVAAEKGRVFCGHGLQHFLDVARLAYIFSLERGLPLRKDVIYAAALLHDIGRWRQYADGTPHEKASAVIAERLLVQSGYRRDEQLMILAAILAHRGEREFSGLEGQERMLAEVIYDADKLSRSCFSCEAEGICDWGERKNRRLLV